jgi:pimeloyl-ACP methyl ester carboxylesterase
MVERMVRANGVDLCIETFGDPQDDTVLLVHGAQASMLWWEEGLCAAIADGGRHVVRYDNRDTGRSVSYPPGRPPYAMSDLARDAVAILDALGVDRAHVVGRSMGGGVGLFIGLDHRARASSLTLVTTTTGDGDLPEPEVDLDSGPIPSPDDLTGLIEHAVVELRTLSGGSPYFDEEAVRQRAARDVDRARDFAATLTNHWVMEFDAPQHGSWADLDLPTLVVQGELDPVFPPAHGRALAATIPGAELMVLPRVGHDVPPPAWPLFVERLLAHTGAAG